MAKEKEVAEITHYFDHLGVAVVRLTAELKAGDEVHIKGHTTDFTQKVTEMQADHEKVDKLSKGSEAGIKVNELVREGDKVYLV